MGSVDFIYHTACELGTLPRFKTRAPLFFIGLLRHLDPTTNEILLSREELAAEFGFTPNDVTQIMAKLNKMGVIDRRHTHRSVRYFLNTNVATRMPKRARAKAQKRDGAPQLALVAAE